jgi:hypothetical protein
MGKEVRNKMEVFATIAQGTPIQAKDAIAVNKQKEENADPEKTAVPFAQLLTLFFQGKIPNGQNSIAAANTETDSRAQMEVSNEEPAGVTAGRAIAIIGNQEAAGMDKAAKSDKPVGSIDTASVTKTQIVEEAESTGIDNKTADTDQVTASNLFYQSTSTGLTLKNGHHAFELKGSTVEQLQAGTPRLGLDSQPLPERQPLTVSQSVQEKQPLAASQSVQEKQPLMGSLPLPGSLSVIPPGNLHLQAGRFYQLLDRSLDQPPADDEAFTESAGYSSNRAADIKNLPTPEAKGGGLNLIKPIPAGNASASTKNLSLPEQEHNELPAALSNTPQIHEEFTVGQADQPLESMKSSGQSVIDQIMDKLTLSEKNGRKELTVQLKPDTLGTVTIRLSEEKGFTAAKIITDALETREMINSQIPALKQQLEQQGISVREFDVVHDGSSFLQKQADSGGNPNSRNNAHRNWNSSYRSIPDGNAEPDISMEMQRMLHKSRINYLI